MYNGCQEKQKSATRILDQETRSHLFDLATKYKNNELLQVLTLAEKYVDFNCVIDNSYSALTKIVVLKNKEMVKLLIKNGADVNFRDGGNRTALTLAISLQDESMVKLLVEEHADINMPDEKDKSPLMRAGTLNNTQRRIFEFLDFNGAVFHGPDNSSLSDEHYDLSLEEDYHSDEYHAPLVLGATTAGTFLLGTTVAIATNITQNAVKLITNNITSIGNTSNSTELQLASLDQIIHDVSTVNPDGLSEIDSSVWIVTGVGAIVGVGLIAGISYITRVFNQTKQYNNSIQATELSQI